jgi:hypothetical protein
MIGLSAAVLMVATEFSTMQSVQLETAAGEGVSSCGAADASVRAVCETSGHEQHHYALLLLAALTVLLAFGAAVGRSRPAALGLAVAGLAVLIIALLVDHPTLKETHGLEIRFARAVPKTGGGYTLELIAGALALAGGILAFVLDREAEPAGDDRPKRRRPATEPADEPTG